MTFLSGPQVDDLLINLLAGFIFFVFETGLIFYLLPRILDRRGRKKWDWTLKRGIIQLLTRQAHLILRFNARAKHFSDDTRPLDPNVATVWVNQVLPPVFAELVPEAKALAERATEQLALYTPALSTKMHRAFVGWVIALDAFAEALNSAAHAAAFKVLNPPKKKEDAEVAIVTPLRQAFEALDAATSALLDEAGIEPTDKGNELVPSRNRLPRDNFEPKRWDWIRDTLKVAMASQRLALAGQGKSRAAASRPAPARPSRA